MAYETEWVDRPCKSRVTFTHVATELSFHFEWVDPSVSFYMWLALQQRRNDRIGVFARHAVSDSKFPRQSKRLHVFLTHVPSSLREPLKAAHREWRHMR